MKHLKEVLSSAAVISLLAAGVTLAQDTSNTAPVKTQVQQKETLKEKIQEKASALKDAREAAKEQLVEKKEELQQKRAEQKENLTAKSTAAQEKREALKVKLEAKKTDAKEKMVAANKARVEKVIKVLEDRVANFNEFITRIEAHIAKLVAAGTDTTNANALLETAKAKVAEADASVDGLYSQVEVALTVTNQKTALQAVTTAARNTEAKVRDAHSAIVNVINSLKPGRNTASQ
jgi:chromosome segregation ATPase